MFRFRWLTVVGLALVVSIGGCGSSSGDLPDLAPVSGTVTLDGQPVGSVSVLFESASGRAAGGTTDENGRYELYFSGGVKGAELGVNTVRITTALDHPAPPDYRDPIPARYNESSELSVTVEPGANTHDFTLQR